MTKDPLIICFFLLAFFLVISSCSDDQCNLDTDTILNTEILVKDATLVSSKFLDSLSIYSPEWTDSIHNSGSSSVNYYLFLSPFSDTSTFILTSQSMLDTVNLFYKRKLVLLSQECGFVTHFTIDSFNFTTNNIDSIFILEDEITTDNDGHIQIYF